MPFSRRYPNHPNISLNPDDSNDIFASTVSADIPPLGTWNIQFKTGNGFVKLIDLDVELLNGSVDFVAIEGATCTDGLTVYMPGNTDRTSATTSMVLVTSDPTGISGGFVARSLVHFALESPISGVVGVEPNPVEWIKLKPNCNYIFSFTNPSPTETVENLQFLLLWAE